MTDFRYLRKLNFPHCAKEALQVVEQLSVSPGRAVTSRQIEQQREDVISEFIFNERKLSPNVSKSSLSSIEELQLLDVLYSYFENGNHANDCFRLGVFMHLFPSANSARSRLLVKFVSMAVAIRSKSVLAAAGTWLQLSGVMSPCSLSLAQGLVNDYFILVPEAGQKLQDLPTIAPLFTANFLAAVSELYGPAGEQEILPPPPLLSVITYWISNYPGLCTASLQPNLTYAAPSSSATVTPFAGLFRWCILDPLQGGPNKDLYSQLHLALMESIINSSTTTKNFVFAQHIAAVIPIILRFEEKAEARNIQKALDRLGQAVLMLFHNRSLFGEIQELFMELDKLPENRLISIAKSRYRSMIQIDLT